MTLDLPVTVEGQCRGELGGELVDLALEMTGEQLVVVDSEGFHGEYLWSGTQSLPLPSPLEEGAEAQGEGWVIVLHLNNP